jgi:hypothetical protein
MRKLLPVLAVAGTAISGCAMKPIHDEDLLKLVDGNVIRMQIDWPEPSGAALMPASYNVEANYLHWTANANQYRWVISEALMRKNTWGRVWRRTLVPDQIPRLQKGDWVDVYVGSYWQTNFGELKAPVVVRLVCKDSDKACKQNSEKELHGKFEVVSTGRPAIVDQLTFTKVHDLEAKALKP